ncbi:MAG TPA: DUF2142 domain-containing protein [Thermoanaerobaculia bacterium]|nr:DUF2142 domain-containing protein [Thermoanaerobaculia bacterium]
MKSFPLTPDRFFLLAGLLFGILLVFVTPPFQVPDEPAHFYRAWGVAEGKLVIARGQGGVGAELPASLPRLAWALTGDMPGHPEVKTSRRQILAWLGSPLDPAARIFVAFPNTALYTFVPYVPQAVAFGAGRALGAPPLVSFYGARLLNLLVSTLLIAFAIRQAPALRWLLATVALTPMATFQRASISADAVTIAVGFVLGAVAARLAWGDEPTAGERRRGFGTLILAAAVLCLCKPAYVPLVAVAFLIPAARLPWGRRAPAFLLYAVLVGLAFAAGMANARVGQTLVREGVGVDSQAQIRDSLAEPVRFLGIVARDYLVEHGGRYFAQMVGQLGWLDTKLPMAFLALYLGMIAAVGLADGGEVRVAAWQRGILLLAVAGALVLLSASQYALWTPYGADRVEGLQGRYFLPVAPVAAWLFLVPWRRSLALEGGLGWGLVGLTLVSVAVTLHALMVRYYG